jgi:hypothetical protein
MLLCTGLSVLIGIMHRTGLLNCIVINNSMQIQIVLNKLGVIILSSTSCCIVYLFSVCRKRASG